MGNLIKGIKNFTAQEKMQHFEDRLEDIKEEIQKPTWLGIPEFTNSEAELVNLVEDMLEEMKKNEK